MYIIAVGVRACETQTNLVLQKKTPTRDKLSVHRENGNWWYDIAVTKIFNLTIQYRILKNKSFKVYGFITVTSNSRSGKNGFN